MTGSSDPVPTLDDWVWSLRVERIHQVDSGHDADWDHEQGVDTLLMWAQEHARRGEMVKCAAMIEAARELLADLKPEADAAAEYFASNG